MSEPSRRAQGRGEREATLSAAAIRITSHRIDGNLQCKGEPFRPDRRGQRRAGRPDTILVCATASATDQQDQYARL